MRRLLALLASAAALLAPVTAARAASGGVGLAPAGAGHPASAAPPAGGTVRGTIVSVGWSQITVRPHGRAMAAGAALTAAADAVAAGDYPYVWGGGHPLAGVASAARPGGPVGFDCSGSVAAVLAGAGLWPVGTGVPSDAGVIATLRTEHLIVRGAGSGTAAVTLWDDPGTHIFMQLGQTFFGTSDGAASSPANPAGGAGWLDDGAPDTQSGAYHPWHLVASALDQQVVYGPTVTVGLGGVVAQDAMTLAVGDRVSVAYATHAHALVAASVAGLR